MEECRAETVALYRESLGSYITGTSALKNLF